MKSHILLKFILITQLFFLSCITTKPQTIYVNNTLVTDNIAHTHSDSIIILGKNEKVPVNATFITNCNVSYQFKIAGDGIGEGLPYVINEAKKEKANIVQIDLSNANRIKQQGQIRTNLYSLPETDWNKLNWERHHFFDTLYTINNSIVYVKSFIGRESTKLYFNKTLLIKLKNRSIPKFKYWWTYFDPILAIYFHNKVEEYYQAIDSLYKTNNQYIFHPEYKLPITENGILSLDAPNQKSYNKRLPTSIEIGKGTCYFLFVFYSGARRSFGPYFKIVTPEEYYLNELE